MIDALVEKIERLFINEEHRCVWSRPGLTGTLNSTILKDAF